MSNVHWFVKYSLGALGVSLVAGYIIGSIWPVVTVGISLYLTLDYINRNEKVCNS